MLALLLVLGLTALVGYTVHLEREATRYPGAVEISQHANYKGLPTHYRWDNSYRTAESFVSVYNWYSTTFNLGAESRAAGTCILLEGTTEYPLVERYMSVFICQTRQGQMIFVSRSTSMR